MTFLLFTAFYSEVGIFCVYPYLFVFVHVTSIDALEGRCRRLKLPCPTILQVFSLKQSCREKCLRIHENCLRSFLLKTKDLFLPLLFLEKSSLVFTDFCQGNLEKIEFVGMGVS